MQLRVAPRRARPIQILIKMAGVALGLLLSVAAALGLLMGRERIVRKRGRWVNRTPMSVPEFQSSFYPDVPLEILMDLLLDISSSLDIPLEYIRPSDRIIEDLGPVAGLPVDGEMDDFCYHVERRCQMTGKDVRQVNVRTVDDYIREFAQRGAEK